MPLVYHVITDKNVGGAGRVLLSLLRNENGGAFTSRVLLPRGSALSPLLAQNGILHTELDELSERSFSFSAFCCFLRYFRRFPCDILISHGCAASRMAGRFCAVPFLLTFKHCDVPLTKGKALLYNFFTDATVAVSTNAQEGLLECGIAKDKIFLFENGVSPFPLPKPSERELARRAFGIASREIAVGLCARIEEIKGHETAIRALASLPDRFSLWFLGEGGHRAPCERLCRALGLQERVHFLGFHANVKPFYYAMDAHVSCSFGSETASLSLAEGMSAGCVTFASDIPGNRARVGDGGLYFPPRDSAALQRLILRMEDGAFRARQSALARARALSLPREEERAKDFVAFLTDLWKKRGDTLGFRA